MLYGEVSVVLVTTVWFGLWFSSQKCSSCLGAMFGIPTIALDEPPLVFLHCGLHMQQTLEAVHQLLATCVT